MYVLLFIVIDGLRLNITKKWKILQEVLGIKFPIIGNFVEVHKSFDVLCLGLPKNNDAPCLRLSDPVGKRENVCREPWIFAFCDYILGHRVEKDGRNAPSNFLCFCRLFAILDKETHHRKNYIQIYTFDI